ncbi:Hypothetical predicted protein [Pelobates cultripes]|uniref:Uncharacterized protein n=1 Tax=Pelobates cultripes TaxID=61616 RepID=A0AAD1RC63_PELCU|nr:Hypothetical predicted protein [Pelobates cultripes]
MGLGVRQEGRRNRYPPTESVRSNFPPKTYLKWPPRENLHRRRHKPKWPQRHVLRMRGRQVKGENRQKSVRGPEENRGIDRDQNRERLRAALLNPHKNGNEQGKESNTTERGKTPGSQRPLFNRQHSQTPVLNNQ